MILILSLDGTSYKSPIQYDYSNPALVFQPTIQLLGVHVDYFLFTPTGVKYTRFLLTSGTYCVTELSLCLYWREAYKILVKISIYISSRLTRPHST